MTSPAKPQGRRDWIGRLFGAVLVGTTLSLFLAAFVAGPLAGSACAAESDPRVDLKVLLISGNGAEPSLRAWQAQLSAQQVPFDTVVLESSQMTTETLSAEPGHGRYQAVVVATSELLTGGAPGRSLDQDEQDVVATYERTFNVRQVVAFAAAVPGLGLDFAAVTDLGGTVAHVTPEGRDTFGDLAGPVPIMGVQGHPATPTPDGMARVEVAADDGRALVASTTTGDGRQIMVVTLNTSPTLLHAQLLGNGLLRWVTRGIHLGLRRIYLAAQVDDVFLPNFRWDVDTDRTSPARTVRMTAADVDRAASWSRRQHFRIDLAFNAFGRAPQLCSALLRHKAEFGWLNHTYSHTSFDDLSVNAMVGEIERNREWADAQRLPLDRHELVTGAHSGLGNPNLPSALAATGTSVIADDASVSPDSRLLGPARTVPRFPTDLYYDVGTFEEQLDEYNYTAYESCQESGKSCLSAPVTFPMFVAGQARTILAHMLANNPRPHYFHQSNLAEDATFFPVLDEVLAQYRSAVTAPIVQQTLSEAGMEMARQERWSQALTQGTVRATIAGGKILLEASAEVDAPLTGWAGGEPYAGEHSGWVRLPAGKAVTFVP